MKKFLPLILTLTIILSACLPEKKIDASSEESYKKSLEEIGNSLNEKEKADFGEALQTLFFSELQDHMSESNGGLIALANMNSDELVNDTMKKMNGKTASDVIELAKVKKLNYKKQQLESIRQEIKELQNIQLNSDKTKEIIEKIIISNPKFYWNKGGYISEPVIDFSIKNETGIPLAKVFFHGVVASPNRTIPWISEDFNYDFKGGIEPNETKELQLAPNSFGEWGVQETKKRDDLVMTITVKNAENADGEEIASSFGEDEEKRLLTLIEQEKKLLSEID